MNSGYQNQVPLIIQIPQYQYQGLITKYFCCNSLVQTKQIIINCSSHTKTPALGIYKYNGRWTPFCNQCPQFKKITLDKNKYYPLDYELIVDRKLYFQIYFQTLLQRMELVYQELKQSIQSSFRAFEQIFLNLQNNNIQQLEHLQLYSTGTQLFQNDFKHFNLTFATTFIRQAQNVQSEEAFLLQLKAKGYKNILRKSMTAKVQEEDFPLSKSNLSKYSIDQALYSLNSKQQGQKTKSIQIQSQVLKPNLTEPFKKQSETSPVRQPEKVPSRIQKAANKNKK